MKIYGNDNTVIADVKVTSSATHEQEMSKSDYVQLSWKSNLKTALPVGTYIIPFADGLKYRLIEPYDPQQDSEDTFTYQPEFQHPLMWLSKVPLTYATKNTLGEDTVQQEWEYTGLTTNLLSLVVKFINDAFGFSDTEKFALTIIGSVDTNVSVSFQSTDVLSALSSIATACKKNKCEWHLSWEHKALYFGQISVNLGEALPLLTIGKNIGSASISASNNGYYNIFFPQGSTRNMSVKAASGENVSTGIRLGLDKTKYPSGMIDTRKDTNEPKQTLALTFDDIYPHVNCYVYDVRKRTRYLLDESGNKVVSTYNADGSVKEYKKYTVWYMRLAYPLTAKKSGEEPIATTSEELDGKTQTLYWYDYVVDDKQIIDGYTLSGSFSVNTNSGALASTLVGQPSSSDGFELTYHKVDETINANEPTGDSGVKIKKGDFEIVFSQSDNTIIPSNESEGLIPRGLSTPSVKGNIVILYNIAMGDDEISAAQSELEDETKKEIAYRQSDLNNYTFKAYPNVWVQNNPHLYIGQRVVYNDGNGYSYTTRVIKLTTNLDYDIVQEITVGNAAIKGTISQLKEDVQGLINGTVSVGSGMSYQQVLDIIKNYVGSRYLSRTHADTAQGLIDFLQGLTSEELATLKKGWQTDGFMRSMIAGKGAGVDARGNAEFESIRSRSSIEALELIVNRLASLEGDQVFTEADTIDTVDNIGDGTYGLHLKRKWDGYFTAIKAGSVLRAIMNTLAQGSGTYYTAWFRVNSVNTANNYIEVSMYADSDTPAGKNYPPCSLMKVSRWGHQTDKTLQSCFYLSSNEGRIVHLVNVTKPIIDKENYGSVIGTLPEFVKSITDENGNPLPLIDGIDYIYAPGIVTRDIIRINKWTMKREPNYVDEGKFVQGGKYYCEATNPDTGVYETSDVWYYGCKWRCCKNLTTTAPAWNNTDWAMIEGNPNFTAEFEEGTDQVVDPENINIPLHLVCTLYNQDVTKDIKDTDVAWTRYSEDADGNERTASDNLWAVNHANSGKSIVLTEADMDFNGYIPKSIKFMATATLRDGMTATATYEK